MDKIKMVGRDEDILKSDEVVLRQPLRDVVEQWMKNEVKTVTKQEQMKGGVVSLLKATMTRHEGSKQAIASS
jgi:hypothetical protein